MTTIHYRTFPTPRQPAGSPISWDVIQELNESYQPLAVKTSQGIVIVDGDNLHQYSYHTYSPILPPNVKAFTIQRKPLWPDRTSFVG